MKLLATYIAILLIVLSPTQGFSHAENNYEDASKALEIALAELAPEKIVVTSISDKDVLKVKYEGKEVLLNKSMMLGAFENVYHELSIHLGIDERKALEEAKLSLFAYLSKKTINLAKTPYIF